MATSKKAAKKKAAKKKAAKKKRPGHAPSAADLGTLPADRLRLCAYLGHEPARELLGSRAPEQIDLSPTAGQVDVALGAWFAGLAEFGKEVQVRATQALEEVVQAEGEEAEGGPDPFDPGVVTCVDQASMEWVLCPCEGHHRRVHDPNEGSFAWCPVCEFGGEEAANWADHAFESVGWTHSAMLRRALADDVDIEALERKKGGDQVKMAAAAKILSQVVRAALLPWALGEKDPQLEVYRAQFGDEVRPPLPEPEPEPEGPSASRLTTYLSGLEGTSGEEQLEAAEALRTLAYESRNEDASIHTDEVVEALARGLLSDLDPQVRYRLASALGSIGTPAAVGTLGSALADPSRLVRKRAAEALGEQRTDAAWQLLEEAAAGADENAKEIAQFALRRRPRPG